MTVHLDLSSSILVGIARTHFSTRGEVNGWESRITKPRFSKRGPATQIRVSDP
jgi:hypothetical protein